MVLSDLELLHWLARWGHTPRLELAAGDGPTQALEFHGEVAELTPHLENGQKELAFTHRLTVPGGQSLPAERGAVLQPPPAAGAGGADVLPAAQRAAAASAGALGQRSRRCRCAS